MYVEIRGPAYRTEYDNENNTKITYEERLTKEIEIESGNPNIDHYFDPDFLYDYRYHTVNGEKWELDTREAEISIDLSVEEVMVSANNRAAEDLTTLGDVLEQWDSYKNAPRAIHVAYQSILHGDAPPEVEQ